MTASTSRPLDGTASTADTGLASTLRTDAAGEGGADGTGAARLALGALHAAVPTMTAKREVRTMGMSLRIGVPRTEGLRRRRTKGREPSPFWDAARGAESTTRTVTRKSFLPTSPSTASASLMGWYPNASFGSATWTVHYTQRRTWAPASQIFASLTSTSGLQHKWRMDVDKQFIISFDRATSCASFQTFLRTGLARGGATDSSKTSTFLAACSDVIPARTRAVFSYRAATNTTTFMVGSKTVTQTTGTEFIKAASGVFLAMPQRGFAEALLAKIN